MPTLRPIRPIILLISLNL
ncbi:hypothetical protein D030_2604, partial [Vibrio parahaemolyticus AQ3810]